MMTFSCNSCTSMLCSAHETTTVVLRATSVFRNQSSSGVGAYARVHVFTCVSAPPLKSLTRRHSNSLWKHIEQTMDPGCRVTPRRDQRERYGGVTGVNHFPVGETGTRAHMRRCE